MDSLKHLRDFLAYCPTTGIFTWSRSPSRTVLVGTPAGGVTSDGYRCITVSGQKFQAHRIAWLFVYGHWPKQAIDHINGNRLDNAISNLRDVSKQTNAENRSNARAGSASGVLGVRKSLNKWAARINVAGRDVHLGSFDTPELAHAAYVAAKRIHHTGCTL